MMDKLTLMKGVRFIEEFRKLDPEMPMQMAAVFLLVAINPDLTLKNISERLGIAQASASRNVAALSDWHRNKKPGHGLIEARPDPFEMRRKILRLTPKGKRVLDSVWAILNAEVPKQGTDEEITEA